MINKSPLILIFSVLIFTVSCRQANNTVQTNESENDLGFGFEEQLEEIYYRFPSPEEMLAIFEEEDLDFSSHILLPVEKSKQYLSSKAQAMNMGIYMADLAYLSLFDQTQDANKYMMAVYGLGDKLRISSAFKAEYMNRLDNNLNDADSLKVLFHEVMNELNNYLEKNHKEKTFILISIGGYIESLYLTFHMLGEFSENNPIVQRITDQKFVLNNLLNFAVAYSSDESVKNAVEIIHPIREKFDELIVTKSDTKVNKNSDGSLTISGGTEYVITKDQYNDLRQVVFNIRRQISTEQ